MLNLRLLTDGRMLGGKMDDRTFAIIMSGCLIAQIVVCIVLICCM